MSDEQLKKIASLTSGGMTVKKIRNSKTGKEYVYNVYQYRENGKQKSIYLKDDEAEKLTNLINEQKDSTEKKDTSTVHSEYVADVIIGKDLKNMVESVKDFKKREIIKQLENYVSGNEFNRVFILYGLRRTGKTTMIKQVISEMKTEQFEKTAYIQISPSLNLGQLNMDLKLLENRGYKYIFIDEVTLMDDFIEGAALLSDLYAARGLKIILSGTDSLGFWLSRSNSLYDRCHLLHTTFIPYREFERVLGIVGLDEYIRYGGTMSISGNRYNVFSDAASADEYIDSAIANNIQHSLKHYQDEGHFRHLLTLYENNELTSAINRVIEDMNHRFTDEVLTREFKSNDLALSARNLRKDNNVLDLIDKEKVTAVLKEKLEIRNRSEQKVEIDEVHYKEIKEYLAALDLIKDINLEDIDHYGKQQTRTVFTQPGLRYCQVNALIETLLKDDVFGSLSFDEMKYVSERIRNEVKGRMLEDIILLETKLACSGKEVFKLQFADGEYDMVIADGINGGCSVYEIKYSSITDSHQYRHLNDEEKIRKTEFRYGKVNKRCVLYRGENCIIDDIQYLNVEKYLNELKNV